MLALVWAEIRRRWRAAAAVGVLFGLGFALALAGAAGARRTETAFSRMVAATEAAELLVSAATEDEVLRRELYDRLATLDGVDGAGRAVAVPLVPVQVPKGEGTALTGCAHLSADGNFGYEITSALTVALAVAVSVMPAINATRTLRAVALRRE